MGIQIVFGTIAIVVVATIHAAGLVYLASALTRISSLLGRAETVFRRAGLLMITVLAIIAIHSVEAWIWAAIYLGVGEFSDIGSALYFSVVTATTLGYGDITLSEQWRLLGTFEAMGGLILFGASTAFFMEFLRRLFFSDELRHLRPDSSGN